MPRLQVVIGFRIRCLLAGLTGAGMLLLASEAWAPQFMARPSVRVTPNVQVEFKWITDFSWFGKVEVFDNPDGLGPPVLTKRSENEAGDPIAATQHVVTVPVAPPLAADTGYFFRVTATDPNNPSSSFATPTPLPPFFTGEQAAATTISIDSRETYLRTSSDPNARHAVPIELVSLGLTAGDTIRLTRLGDFNCHATCGDVSIGMIAVFSSSNALLLSDQPHRVPGAIDAGEDVVTAVTHFGQVTTDIPEDFAVLGTGVTVTIPVGATYLFVTAHDTFYGDNGDPDGDFAVRIDQVPVANAGLDQSVNEDAVVTLDGTASTGQNLSFDWQQIAGPAVALDEPTSPSPSFTAPQLPGGFGSQVLTLQLTVTGGSGSSSDTVDVTVVNVNRAPVAEAGGDQTVNEGSTVALDGSASFDPDDDTITHEWIQTGGTPVELTGSDTAAPSFTAPLLAGGSGNVETLMFELTVFDGALSGTDTVQVVVEQVKEQVNHAPVANAGADQTSNEGVVVTLDGTASGDPDGDPITYSWSQVSGPAVALSDASSATPSFTAPLIGPGGATMVFELTVSDGFLSNESALDEPDERVTVHVVNVNDPPLCTAARPSPALLWPPNHKMVQVAITGLADPNDDETQIAITGVTQDEPPNGLGDGDTSPDAVIQEDDVLLRAERSGDGNGRVYRIDFIATDSQGGSCAATVQVGVPHSMKPGAAPADDGQLYDSTLP